ncbi:MAG: tRNA (adenosine(37)-N6)-threonylcarbamoyltransferase complex ATPase subunit type 1 TsaE [SAR202 cluster bacterium]|nr:tRNA (adenosine(37)-N6)-threonylcarbamoyltransferase complex ATPase subunit type 1 TsaE [Chloroflexota bacterium]MDP6420881.1 tRNA (adenosine(37)-N6)-threonylcarbamoyltransferase complex ATPase subunit type 1 TsaE [SAR202 cluster bacterium]HAL46683.1 tRNA (adenosine(37)-N6)-threonylcarbamoyltransferase complex ATPase subunit type 1 TsaE [Dehalococcoidia bacterium]MDP6663803.1 tRNA (adenosine(37)-N6)-threonylcarbamoyltransferase complex ATPase subunit type 1 TsaE [SAR202 cluster bacterium]MDP|tara:strand:- start:248 stop:727 length:480 start_codon:yes stop_codon:yes gene_type:complete
MSYVCVGLTAQSPEETQAIGRLLGMSAMPGDVYLLVGNLGAGKTTLTQGILWGLGSDEYARSPTFVLVNEYNARLTMYHMDLYRLDSYEEIVELGLEEHLDGDGVCVVEWADKAPGYFPEDHAMITLDVVDPDTRRISLSSESDRYAEIARVLQAQQSK